MIFEIGSWKLDDRITSTDLLGYNFITLSINDLFRKIL